MKRLRIAAVFTTFLTLTGCLNPVQQTVKNLPDTSAPTSRVAPALQSSGTLAYVGADGNIWVTSPSDGWTRQVTTDATAPPEGQGRSYHRVAWSRDGALAFAAVVRSEDRAQGELFLQQALDEPPRLVARSDQHFFIYLYMSPIFRRERPGSPSLAYLVAEENGVGLHLVTKEEDDVQDLLIAVGRPFYLSWSPDGQRILWHTGGAFYDNPAAEIGLYHIGNDRRILPYAPGTFQAPAWSPDGEHWLSVVASDGVDRLQHITPDISTTLTTTSRQEIAFVWSSNGERIAYATREPSNMNAYGPIHVVNLETGQKRQVTNDAFNILGFFWSPDDKRLAYLTRLDLPGDDWMQWRTFKLANDHDRGFTAFHPSPLMRFVIHSFGQYAQSHRFWSLDGRYLVYADRDDQGTDRVWLVDTDAEKGADPILISEGSIGFWSWR